jgi:LysM repeat protein
MTFIRIFAPSLLALACFSCAAKKTDSYDTVNSNPTANESVNPVYDTPAAYEESGRTAAATAVPTPDTTTAPTATTPTTPKVPSNGAATIHTVVAGDTLSGISAKYKVPAATIKQANNMTKDTVVLGKKMVIPTGR